MLLAPPAGHVSLGFPSEPSDALPSAVVTASLVFSSPLRPTINAVSVAHTEAHSSLNKAPHSPTVIVTPTAPISSGLAGSTIHISSPVAMMVPPPPEEDVGECSLLGPFALLVQLALGGLALLSLVYKRWRERPQRPVKIWFFDVSKQVFGSVLVHVANVFMSLLTSGKFSIRPDPIPVGHAVRRVVGVLLARMEDSDAYMPNPCSFYLLNLAIDTTIGIPILILLLRLTTLVVSYTPLGKPPESIQSGNYGDPPNAWWWFKQSIMYFCGLFGMKLCVLVIFLAFPWIERVGDWALSWTEGNEKVQIVFVMMLFPLIMNALQYYIIDSFIKGQLPLEDAIDSDFASTGSGCSTEHPAHVGAYDRLPTETVSDSEDAECDVETDRKHRAAERVRLSRRDGSREREYDPAVDGDSQTVTGSSGSATERGQLLPKELYPPE
ncbi:hypothetical protein VTK73DRAFT_3253 [Phialemonium thermophilum]|uniref:Vacuolar membrane protein n=1 Tax=Phialemonium thermophilum TaxID=223376 RepID=A0ABR3Y9Y0_9PEZI